MSDQYLICNRCKGYYKLEDDESPEDFERCSCGGELIPVEDVDNYYDEYYGDHLDKKSRSKKSMVLVFSASIVVFMLLVNFYFSPLSYLENQTFNKDMIGLDDRGYVTKDIYPGISVNGKAIAVVTGIHPREKLSKKVTGDVIRNLSSYSDLKIIHYDITVTNNPENYNVGRNNGEGLAADYILPDIKKQNIDMVIICHDHKPGYGSGFYVATPEMDEKSVKFAEQLNQTLDDFRYYRTDNIWEHSTSAIRLSKPLASAGYITLVYEMPGLETYNNAYNMTYKLLETSSMFLP